MDELTVFQYFVKLNGFDGLQKTPNRFENRFHKVFIIREIGEIRGLTSVFGINYVMNPPDWPRCTEGELWRYVAWHLEGAGIHSVLVGGAVPPAARMDTVCQKVIP